jgi:copper(I)-binding protein
MHKLVRQAASRALMVFAVWCAVVVSANGSAAETLAIQKPWSRATAPGQSVGAGYVTIVNQSGTEDRLMAVTTDISTEVQLHTTSMEGGVMRMRQVVDGIVVPANGSVELKPRGLHIMFVGLKAPLEANATFLAELQFQKAGTMTVRFSVN